MFAVTLDRSYYSKSDQIFKYLKEMFGSEYTVSQMFGYTTIRFVDEEKLKEFNEWVNTL